MNILPKDIDLDINLFENIFTSMTNSYKIFWFNSIFKGIMQEKKVMSFKEIAIGMICDSWYPLLTYNLNFGLQDQLQNVVININENYIKNESIKKEDLYKNLLESDDPVLEKLILTLTRYVPYRLLTPFYEEKLIRLKDGVKNSVIENLTINDKSVLYTISSNKKEIYINDIWFKYIYENQSIIRGWLNYKMIEFLQIRNPSVPAIINKLSPPIKRDLSLAKKYWNTIINNTNICDIYSGLEFTPENFNKHGSLSIDHFIPWSYIGHDKLWNLTPTFDNINSSKNNKMADMNTYMKDFLTIQYLGINYIKGVPKAEKYLEDYLDVDKTLNIKEICSIASNINERAFKSDLEKVIKPIYQLAYNQGFRVWTYDGFVKPKENEEGNILKNKNKIIKNSTE